MLGGEIIGTRLASCEVQAQIPKKLLVHADATGVCAFAAWYTLRISVILVPTNWARGVRIFGIGTAAKAALIGDITTEPVGVCALGVECVLLGTYMLCRGLSVGKTNVTLFTCISNGFFIRAAAIATFAMLPNDFTGFAPCFACTGEVTGEVTTDVVPNDCTGDAWALMGKISEVA